MRLRSTRVLIFSALLPAALASVAGVGGSDVIGTYYYPTSSTYVSTAATEAIYIPTSYSYTSASYAPTVYGDSTYATSSYYLPTTSYSYRSRYVSPRRAARMGLYTPTTYYEYLPTVYSTPLVATTAPLLTTTTATVSNCVGTAPPAMPAPPASASAGATPTIRSTPLPPPATPAAPADKPLPEPSLLNKPDGTAPAPDATKEKEQVPPAPIAPPAGDPVSPPPANEAKAPGDLGASAGEKPKPYLALKPKPGELTMAPTRPAALIRGRVTSGVTGAPLPKAKVVLSNTRFANPRTYTADDLGAFEVPFLPEGDWTLAVEDKDGKALDFGVLTVSAGRVYDDQGRVWNSFNLSR